MKLVQATTTKTYEAEKLPLARFMSQGIKLSGEVVGRMGIDSKSENEADRQVNYALDEDNGNAIYLYKTDKGRTVGSNNCFVNSGLQAEMKKAANATALSVKGGNQIHFIVGEGVESEGVTYFPLTFSEIVYAKDSTESTVETPVAPVAEEEDGF
jgi:hypothetical protein